MLRFILGKSGTGKTTELYRLIREKVSQGKKKLIVLIPDQISLETEKAVLELLGAADKQLVNVFGFNKLCRFVYEQTKNPQGLAIDSGTRAVIMSRALDDLDGELRLLHTKNNKSLTRLMLDALTECKKGGVGTEAMRLASQNPEIAGTALQKKLLDTADIFDVFSGRLAQTHIDPLDDLDRVVEILRTHTEVFEGFTVFIDGYSGFTAQQLRLVEHMLLHCEELVLTLTLDPLCIREEGVFATPVRTYNRVRHFAQSRGVKILKPIECNDCLRFHNEELSLLEAGVFRGGEDFEISEAAPEGIFLYPADDAYDECEYAAREIKKLILRGDYRYADIGVITRDTKLYSGVINAIFDKYEIPYFLDEHKDLDVKPVARAVNAVFRILLNSFEREDVLLLLKSGLLPFTDSEVRDGEEYVFVWDIDNAGFKKPFTQSSRGFGEVPASDPKRDNAEKIRKTVTDALLRFRDDCRELTAGEMTERLYSLLTEDFGVRKGIDRLCQRLENGVSTDVSEEQVRIWELVVKALDRFREALGGERLSLRRYYELLSLELSAIEFAEIPRYLDSVIITNAQRVRDPRYKAVFLIGCSEGSFPANPQSGGLFSDYELQTLSEFDLKMTDSPVDFVSLEIFMAYNCMAAASDLLFLSYPKLALSSAGEESAGGRLTPSVLVDELKKVFPNIKPTVFARKPYEEMLVTRATAFEAYAASLTDENADLSALREVFAGDAGYAARLEAVEDAVEGRPFMLCDRDSADRLFGKTLDNSASKVQTFYQCPFRYFCAYGLRVDERRKAEINPIERGNLVHRVLEDFFNIYRAKSEYAVLRPDEIREFVEKEYKAYLEAYMGGMEDKDGAFAFQLEMLMDKTVKVIQYVSEELANSPFDVEDTELDFPNDMLGYSYTLPDGHEIRIRGKVDRVDSSVQNGKKYIRIIDYKSKSAGKGFSLTEAYYGLDLQMLIYLIAITRNGAYRYGDFTPGGVLYSNVLFNGFSESEAKGKNTAELIREAFMLRGLYLNEKKFSIACKDSFKTRGSTKVSATELETVFKKVDLLIKEMGESLYEGVIPAQSLRQGASTTCDYCAYPDACSYHRSEPKKNIFEVEHNKKREYVLSKMKEDVDASETREVNGNE